METEKLFKIMDFMADRIAQLMENECGNSGENWRQAYNILREEINPQQ